MKKKTNWSNLILILIFLVGLSLMLYPAFSDYWNSFTQTQVISSYTQEIAKIDNETYAQIWDAARQYNAALLDRENPYVMSGEELARYESNLSVNGSGVMGYVEIPLIGVNLPIYHGTDDSVLQTAVGHIEWSSLPVGGENTHAVISGHRGMPSARLFTDIDRLAVKDLFLLHILDETFTYEVDQIRIVEPEDTEDLLVQEGKDLCTLVTCTPYGINSHRLLVRGHRVENQAQVQAIRVTADAMLIKPMLVAPIVAAPMLLLLLVVLLITTRKKR